MKDKYVKMPARCRGDITERKLSEAYTNDQRQESSERREGAL